MKAIVTRKAFVAAINAAADAVDRRGIIPILACVKLTVAKGELDIFGTDLEIARLRRIEADTAKPGACAVDARKLKSALKGIKGGVVTLSLNEGNWLSVESGGATMTLATLDAEKFPPIPGPEADWRRFGFCASVLARLLDKTAFCASTDEGRVNLNGVYLERAEAGVRMVATDGHRLAVAEASHPVELPAPMIIRRSALKHLAEMAKAAEGGDLEFAVKLGEDGRCVSLVAHGAADTLTVRLIDKEFPDYRQVIPDVVAETFYAEADELAAALKEVTAISSDRSRPVKFECAANLESLKLSARNYDMEESVRSIRVSGLSKGFDPIGFNAKYLLEALARAKGGTVEFGLGEDFLMPWTMENVCDPLWRYVLVPMRATW